MSHADMPTLKINAQRAGFRVYEDDGLWWITVPARPRHPENVQGAWQSPERAWRAAAGIWLDVFDTRGTTDVAAE